MTPALEAVAALLLLANVWLVARRSLWNYAFGIAAVILYAFLFWNARLYAATGLQLLFLGLNLYGLMTWKRAMNGTGDLPVTWMSGREKIETLVALVAIAAPIAWLLVAWSDAASPVWDSVNTALALGAQFWQARRRVECWLLWIAVNIGSVGLYASQALWTTSATYAVLLLVAVYGWRQWRQAETE